MRNGITQRFTDGEAQYLTDMLRSVYKIRTCDGGEDEVLADLISALNDCDSIEIVEEDEGVRDEN